MKSLYCFPVLLLGLLAVVPIAWAQEHQHRAGNVEQLGQVDFPTSCNTEVQDDVNRAVAMLHSFWYQAADKAFSAVTEKEPGCAIGYWGVAMSRFHQLWEKPSSENIRVGQAALQKAAAIDGKTAREHAYVAALQQIYSDADEVGHLTRMIAYETAMEELYRTYPDDAEAAIFYALSLLGTAYSSPPDKSFTRQKKAGVILEEVFARQPNHPGVAHYVIHSYDYPPLAERALEAARRYAKIAPDAPHALHMPSHIFTRRGLWQESITSNRAAAISARRENWTGEEMHATDYLTYAYLQGAQDGEAKKMLNALPTQQLALKAGIPNYAAGVFAAAAIPARYAVERRKWDEAAQLTVPPNFFPGGKLCWAEATLHFARGLGAAYTKEMASARQSIEQLERCREILKQADEPVWAKRVDVQRRSVAAWMAFTEDKTDDALRLMRSAAELEDSTDKPPVTPGAIVPGRELLAEMLLEVNRPADALIAFEVALQDAPNRFRSLYGAAQAAELSGNVERAGGYYARLVEVCRPADTKRAELRQARDFLNQHQHSKRKNENLSHRADFS